MNIYIYMNLQSLLERVENSMKNYNDIIWKMTIRVRIRIFVDDPHEVMRIILHNYYDYVCLNLEKS